MKRRSDHPAFVPAGSAICGAPPAGTKAGNYTTLVDATVITQRWRKGEDGGKRLVERQKRVKRWWSEDMLGLCVLTVRYGAKLLEFERGKAAIAVGDKVNLIPTIDAVLAAAAAGELDAAITATQKTGQKPKVKAA